MIKHKFRKRVDSYTFVNDRMINVRIKCDRGVIIIIGIYAPEKGRKEEHLLFYKSLIRHLDTINENDGLIVGADFNARIGQTPVRKIIEKMEKI